MDDANHLFTRPLAGNTVEVRSQPNSFRADTDQSGEWYVWTRLGSLASGLSTIGWATMQRCETRELAQRLADDLNQRSLRVAV